MLSIPSALSPPPSQLHEAETLPEKVRKSHYGQAELPAVEVVRFENVHVGGTGILIDSKRMAVAPESCFPGYLANIINDKLKRTGQDVWLGALGSDSRRETRIHRPVFMTTHPNFVYGHFLIEMLPRILWARDLHLAGEMAPFVFSTRIPPWARALIEAVLSDCDVIWYDSEQEVLVPDAVLVPSRMELHGRFHPIVSTLVDRLIDRLVDSPEEPIGSDRKRVYLSRRKLDLRWRWHTIEQEDLIETFFVEKGFEIVFPEQLSFKDQLTLFRHCHFIAGAYGSALHNSLFAPLGAKVMSLNWINNFQSGICSLRRQPVAFVTPKNGVFVDHTQRRAGGLVTFEIDVRDIERVLESMDQAK